MLTDSRSSLAKNGIKLGGITLKDLQEKSCRKPKLIPLTEDIMKLKRLWRAQLFRLRFHCIYQLSLILVTYDLLMLPVLSNFAAVTLIPGEGLYAHPVYILVSRNQSLDHGQSICSILKWDERSSPTCSSFLFALTLYSYYATVTTCGKERNFHPRVTMPLSVTVDSDPST